MQKLLAPHRVGSLLFGLCTLAWGCSGDPLPAYVGATGSSSSTGGSSAGSPAASGGTGSITAGSSSVAGDSAVAGGSGVASGEFPCDVQSLLATKCLLCHKADPPGSLASSADFRKASTSDPSKSVGEIALERLQATDNTRMPPPPLDAASATEIDALKAWVQAGSAAATCGQTVPTAADPYDTPVVCTSMKNWTGGNRESPQMRPGGACISCHSKGEGPTFAVSGTVYPTPHEPDDCNGITAAAGAQVVVTEANGTEHTLQVNSAGNFYLEARGFKYPYQAKVVSGGKERVMVEAQTSGDCNNCHTQDGREKAPGRIFVP